MCLLTHADVDWCRNSIQILFVDGSDTVRARMAAGLLEIVSSWNHLGRMVDQDRCGLYATPKEQLPASTTVALLSQSYSLKIMPYHFVQPCQRFEVEDLHRYDLVIALDTAVEGHILAAVSREAEEQHGSSYYKYLRGKVALFSDFFGWCSDEEVGKEDPTGARSLLPPSLVDQLCPRLEEARRLPDVMRPDLQSPEGMDEWHDMNSGLLLGCACESPSYHPERAVMFLDFFLKYLTSAAFAGLIRYLMDSFPDNLRGLHANDL